MLGVQHGVVPAVRVAPEVSQPNVITSICQDVTQSFTGVRHHPVSRGTEETVLNEDDRSLEARISLLAVRDPVQGEDVAVLGGGPVLLSRVAVVPDEVGLIIRDPTLSYMLSRGHLTVGSSFLRTGLADLATLPGSVWDSSSLFSHQPSLPATTPTATNRRISPLSPITESSGWSVFTSE